MEAALADIILGEVLAHTKCKQLFRRMMPTQSVISCVKLVAEVNGFLKSKIENVLYKKTGAHAWARQARAAIKDFRSEEESFGAEAANLLSEYLPHTELARLEAEGKVVSAADPVPTKLAEIWLSDALEQSASATEAGATLDEAVKAFEVCPPTTTHVVASCAELPPMCCPKLCPTANLILCFRTDRRRGCRGGDSREARGAGPPLATGLHHEGGCRVGRVDAEQHRHGAQGPAIRSADARAESVYQADRGLPAGPRDVCLTDRGLPAGKHAFQTFLRVILTPQSPC
jgi:hypothetical protein